MIELAKNARFVKIAPVPTKALNEREREELVTRFFAYRDGLLGYRDRPAIFLFDYTREMNARFAQDPRLIAAYRNRFNEMVEFIERYTPNGFRKTKTSTTTPRARFEALAVGSSLAIEQKPELAVKGPSVAVTDWLDSEDFSNVTTSDGANVLSKLRGRINFVLDRLLA